MRLNEFFEGVFYINLRRRFDRLVQINQELDRHDIKAELVEAIDGNDLELPEIISSDGLRASNGDIACALSHSKVCKLAKERRYKNYLVLEDDCILSDNFEDKFSNYIKQVPLDWNLLYIGGSINCEQVSVVSDNIVEAVDVYTTHAMGINSDVYDELIELWEMKKEKVDLCVAQLQKKYKTYCFTPFLIGQRPSYSDILNKHTDYKHLRV